MADKKDVETQYEEQTPELQKLRNAVEHIDRLSQEGFLEISAIAKLALHRLESPGDWEHLDVIARALGALRGKAESTTTSINLTATAVGCHHVDEAQRRRWEAWLGTVQGALAKKFANPDLEGAPDG